MSTSQSPHKCPSSLLPLPEALLININLKKKANDEESSNSINNGNKMKETNTSDDYNKSIESNSNEKELLGLNKQVLSNYNFKKLI